MKLVDPIYLKKYTKTKIPKKKPINLLYLIFFFIVFFFVYHIYNYIKTTPIVNPDLESLPKNIRELAIFKDIERISLKNKPPPKIYKTLLKAYNDDEVNIKYSNAL